MLDITLLRKDLASVVARLETRKKNQPYLDVARFSSLEAERKTRSFLVRCEILSSAPGRLAPL